MSTDNAPDPGKEEQKLASRAGVVGLGTLLSRALGLLRDLVLAAVFPRAATDLFFVAFTIPNALRQLLAEGALSSAFVPVLARVEAQEGKLAAARFYARLRGAMWLVLLATCALGILGARWLCELFAAGFHGRADAFERTVRITRVVFPYLLFMGLAALGAGALQTRRRFAVASFAPALLNVGMIATALLLPRLLEVRNYDPLYALAIGALIGGFLQVVAQAGELRRAGFTEPLQLDLRDPRLREVLRLVLPMTVGMMIYEIDLVLSRRFLSQAGEGANSYFYYAQRLCDFPQGVFSLALSTAALPSLARLAAAGQRVQLAQTAARALRLSLYVGLPASMLLVALARPTVQALFARGAFDAVSVDGTARALVVQALGIFIVATVRQLVPVFYALGDTRTPVVVSALDLLAFIAIALVAKGPWGHVGVSAAVTGSSLVQALLLAWWLRARLPELRGQDVLPSALRSSLAAAGAGAAAWYIANHILPSSALLTLLGGTLAFGMVYVLLSRILGQPEQALLLAGLRRRLRPSNTVSAPR